MFMNEKGAPWKRQRELKKQAIPDQSQIISMAHNNFATDIERALFILAYLTAGRVTELVRCDELKRYVFKKETSEDKKGNKRTLIVRNDRGVPIVESVERVRIDYPGVLAKNITVTERKGKRILLVRIQNRKNKQFTWKNIPIPMDKEGALVGPLLRYVGRLEPEESLFPFRRGKAEQIISKRTNMNIHFLRDIRLTHLTTVYDFNEMQLAKFAGWRDGRPAERYVRLSYSDLVSKY